MVDKLALTRDKRLSELAERQHGVATLRQLVELGLSRQAIAKQAAGGRLHRIHRSVYAVGHAGLSDKGRWMAAVLALGPGAALSHRSAARLWQLLPADVGPRASLNQESEGHVHVTVPSRSGRGHHKGIHIHRPLTLSHRDLTLRHRIPVTTPARTLEDFRRGLTAQEFNAVLRQAELRGYPVDGVAIAGRERTRSELERRFIRLCRRHRLPPPEVNARIGNHEADFLWRTERLIAETDGWSFHRGRAAFELDRRREASLAAAGFEVMRFTWRQVEDDPRGVALAVRARLTARA